MKNLVLLLLCLAAAPGSHAASIRDSKHDLSADSATPGPRAVGEKDSCIFCHSSHRPAVLRPLWNRAETQQTFTFYASNYLNSYLGMTAPTMSDLAASKTKLCLSCHDGVTALGAVYNLAPNTLEMTGAMSAASVLGTDLRNDHPVLYDVKPGAGPPTEPATDPEIRLPPAGDKVKVYDATNRVECTSCHDPHDNQYGKFLVKPNANAALCTTCHAKTNYTASAHAVSNVAYTPAGGSPTTVREWSCRNCHRPHGASSAQAYLLNGAEEATCFACHGNPPLTGAKNILSLLSKTYKHPTGTLSGTHKNPETDASNLGTGKRHAECWDCHNPHQAKSGTHASPGNAVSNALLGGWGVLPSWGTSAWSAATTYVRQVFNDTTNYKEYQLCLKCHSYYAFGGTPPAGATDLSVALNPNNRSTHPVRDSLNNQTGSVSPKALTTSGLSAPWNVSGGPGTQKMSCSDCHGSEVTSDPKGPHGSAAARILKGPRTRWPKNAAGALWTLNDVRNNANNWSSDLFCVNCHPLYSNGSWVSNAHREHESRTFGGQGTKCILCHVVTPHGSKRGRLIGYATDPAPYNYAGPGTFDKLVLSGFKKASSPTNYSQSNCYSQVTGCHNHTNQGGYDP